MNEKIGQMGGNITLKSFPCNYCVDWKSGGFNPDYGMELCANKLVSRNHQEDTMAHGRSSQYHFIRMRLYGTN